MPTKAKTSDWQPVDREYVRAAQDSYPRSALDEAVEIAGPLTSQAANKLRKNILDIVGLLAAELHFENRPKAGEKKEALRRLFKELMVARRTLKNLDADSREDLGEIGKLEGRPRISANQFSDDRQRLLQVADSQEKSAFMWLPVDEAEFRFADVERSFDLLCMWSFKAYRHAKNTPLGPPQKLALRQAVIRAAVAWRDAKTKPATRRNKYQSVWPGGGEPYQAKEYGPFREFANAIVRPYNLTVVDTMAKQVIEYLKEKESGTDDPT